MSYHNGHFNMKKVTLILYYILLITNISLYAYESGTRIVWDYSTRSRVDWGGYPRAARLQNGDILMAIGNWDGGISIYKSNAISNGASWTLLRGTTSTDNRPKKVNSTYSWANANLIQLNTGKVLLSYNSRPFISTAGGNPFRISTIMSINNGNSWFGDKVLFNATDKFTDGCWEPDIIQLPNGKIQLYFANEFPYQNSGEQEISMMESTDNGCTWSQPRKICFRRGSRDGMPSPILLSDGNTIAMAIEDLVGGTMRPVIATTTLTDNWNTIATPDKTTIRWDALTAKASNNTLYSGAPQLRMFPTGETILSYQSTWGRDYSTLNNENNSDMVVAIGDNQAKNFSKKTKPFNLSTLPYTDSQGTIYRTALWSSILVVDDKSVIAMTSSNEHIDNSPIRWGGVYVIKGQKLPDLLCTPTTTASTPVFIGAYTSSSVSFTSSWNATSLTIKAIVKDNTPMLDAADYSKTDGISISFDVTNKNMLNSSSVIAFHVGKNGLIKRFKGSFSGWVADGTSTSNVTTTTSTYLGGYTLEITIPWTSIGGLPAVNYGWGVNFALRDVKADGSSYIETVSSNDSNDPSTWCRIDLKN